MFASMGPEDARDVRILTLVSCALAAVSGVLLVTSIVIRARRHGPWAFPALLLAMLALHPAWTISAMVGDAGGLKARASWCVTGAGGLVLFAQAFGKGRSFGSPLHAPKPPADGISLRVPDRPHTGIQP